MWGTIGGIEYHARNATMNDSHAYIKKGKNMGVEHYKSLRQRTKCSALMWGHFSEYRRKFNALPLCGSVLISFAKNSTIFRASSRCSGDDLVGKIGGKYFRRHQLEIAQL